MLASLCREIPQGRESDLKRGYALLTVDDVEYRDPAEHETEARDEKQRAHVVQEARWLIGQACLGFRFDIVQQRFDLALGRPLVCALVDRHDETL